MKRIFGLVVLIALVAVVGNAQIGLKAVGGEVGYASFSASTGGFGKTESFGGIMFGGVANLGEITPGLSLYPSVTYASASKDFSGTTVKLSDFAINANVKYSFKAEGFTPYVGGGLGMNFGSVSISGFPGSASSTNIGINFLGGAEMKFGSATGFAQLGYNLVSDMNNLQILAGVMFPLK